MYNKNIVKFTSLLAVCVCPAPLALLGLNSDHSAELACRIDAGSCFICELLCCCLLTTDLLPS